jgi:hypothetical protein
MPKSVAIQYGGASCLWVVMQLAPKLRSFMILKLELGMGESGRKSMGTKNKPGKFDCYANAEPDEPMFILLGRDPMAGALVRMWAEMRANTGENSAKVKEALDCADALDAWAESKGKTPIVILRRYTDGAV